LSPPICTLQLTHIPYPSAPKLFIESIFPWSFTFWICLFHYRNLFRYNVLQTDIFKSSHKVRALWKN